MDDAGHLRAHPSRMMRILIANEAFAGGGGVETYLSALVPALQAEGHEVGVLHDNPSSERGPQRIGSDATWRVSVQDEGSVERAIDRVRAFAPHVCFSHNMRRLEVDAALAAGWPVVKMMHGHFGTCVSGQKAFGFPTATPCPRTFGPGCVARYFPRRCGEASLAVLARSYRWGTEQRSLFPRYRAIVVASGYMRDEFVRAGAAPDAVHMLPLFAPQITPPPAAAGRAIDVIFLGRFTPLKGPDVLLDAAHRAGLVLGRPLNLVLAGEGPLRDRLERQAARAGIKASFPGWVSPEVRDRLLGETSIVAVPSRWHEPFGLVGLEAAALGVPAVAFDTGGIGQWLRHDVNGLLVDPGSGAAGMADAIAAILQRPEWHRRLSAGAVESARRFTLGEHVRGIVGVLAGAAGSAAA
jgi:glycosyltransferase involved in cell wall biosynthesis